MNQCASRTLVRTGLDGGSYVHDGAQAILELSYIQEQNLNDLGF